MKTSEAFDLAFDNNEDIIDDLDLSTTRWSGEEQTDIIPE